AACGASVSVRVHVRVRVPEHVQPVPEAAVGFSPVGIASVTVTVEPPTGSASDGVSSRFVTVIVIVPLPPRLIGECVASMPSPSGATNHCAGGVPARSRKLYGTGLVICGIGVSEGT